MIDSIYRSQKNQSENDDGSEIFYSLIKDLQDLDASITKSHKNLTLSIDELNKFLCKLKGILDEKHVSATYVMDSGASTWCSIIDQLQRVIM